MTSRRPNSTLGPGGPGSKGPGHTRRRGRREKHPAGAVGGGAEQRVRRAAQRRRLPGVCHHVQEGAARAEASDGSALPAVVGPPVDHGPAHQRSAQVAGRRRHDREACRHLQLEQLMHLVLPGAGDPERRLVLVLRPDAELHIGHREVQLREEARAASTISKKLVAPRVSTSWYARAPDAPLARRASRRTGRRAAAAAPTAA